ncbi:MAG: HEPN domain-containing protein [Thermaurantiacus sp.]|uniref:HEPN domain-containing protein n=1 Tax=Thermaurantiacus sp. TaxID=2820283 RepID=UPI00298EF27C|nr:HEPN domain-containing protein [Thermaurantiacus sp.]MDW8413977.1 HEPN domain-containing protein [Thermaurantiacus sp.]
MPGAEDLAQVHARLKDRQRAERDRHPRAMDLRVHRALSWLGRAAQEADDDVRFILLWVAFNAAFAADLGGGRLSTRDEVKAFFERVCRLDAQGRVYAAVWTRFSQEIRLFLGNPYVFPPFWAHHNGEPGYADWEERLNTERRAAWSCLAQKDTAGVLRLLFERLYVLRNQLVHGGATWASSVNRQQVRDGAAILGTLVPLFVEVMLDHPHEDWGRPYYPVVEA